ncbi:hypothetical protein BC629DRAFT_1588506 [Irpex lacteus]|nr:hypothetical protein BC629DRAFT_1588506 [Irpex lacteus]
MMLSSKSSLGALSTSNSANSDISYMSVSEAAARSHQESHGGSSTASTNFDFTSEIIPVRAHNLYQYSHVSSSTPSTNTFGIPKFLPPSSLTSEPLPHDLVSQLPPPSERLNLPVPGTCIFKPTGNGTMALYPPKKAALQTPLYIINVSPNCFVPTSFVTTVESGRTERLVATFEMGPSRDPPTLFTDNTAY